MLLVSDYSIVCFSSKWWQHAYFGFVFFVLYFLGLPLFFFALLYKNYNSLFVDTDIKERQKALMEVAKSVDDPEPGSRKEVEAHRLQSELYMIAKVLWDNKLSVQRLGFLYKSYKPHAWHWEIAEMGFRVLLTSVVTLLPAHSTLQLSFTFVVLLMYFLLHNKVRSVVTYYLIF